MTYPPKPDAAYDYVSFQADSPTDPLPANQVAADFAHHKTSIDAIVEFSKLVQRSDGAMQNGSVRPESLSPTTATLMGGWNPRGAWVTATAYAVKDVVEQPAASGLNYICVTAHTSGVFATDLAAGKWQTISTVGLNTANDFTGGSVAVATQAEGDADTSAASTLFASIVAALPPQGRLTLATGVPVMTSAQLSKTVVFYTPYSGYRVLIYNGTSFVSTVFTELSNDTTATTVGKAGPAAVANNSNYDLFVWNDSGTVRLTRGPLWTSDTVRGTGAGTTELQRVNGILTNKVAITNGPGAGLGTYVGTVRSDGSAQLNWQTGANGTPALLNVWNAFNRKRVTGMIGDTVNSWAYTTATVRAAGGVNTVRASFVHGFQEDFFEAEYVSSCSSAAGGANANVGIGFDVTNAFTGRIGAIITSTVALEMSGSHRSQALGFHFMQACEISSAVSTTTWFGDAGVPATIQTGMTYDGWF